MPRYDDRYGNTRLYVGRLSSRTRSHDLERFFSRYGRIRDVDMKHDFAFVEFSDPRDADDARYHLDGREFDGSRIIVEFARRGPRGSREYLGRGPPPGSGHCFNCGIDGHWARDCKAGDWKNKCYHCGERGHVERNCKNSPKELRRGRSYSRSPVRSRSPHRGRSQSRSYSTGCSYSRSRSQPKRERSMERGNRVRSPEPRSSPPPYRGRKRSLTPDEGSPMERNSPPPSRGRKLRLTPDEGSPVERSDPPLQKMASQGDGSEYGGSPREKSRNPASLERESPVRGRYQSSYKANGQSRSPSPRDSRSPVNDDYDKRGQRSESL